MKVNKYLSESGYLFVILFGVALYFQQSWVPGFFLDGYLYAAFAKHGAEGGYWLVPHLSHTTYTDFPVHPPFIFSLNGLFFKAFGTSYSAARIFGGLFSFTCLISLIKMVRKHGNDQWAFLTGLLFVCIPPLIKKTRFPNLDAPLMLFVFLSLSFYYDAFKKEKKSSWILCGIFFGLAMLTKGPMGGLVPLGIISHLIATKSLKRIWTFTPWFSLLLGFLIFSIWPISLYLNGYSETFDWYIKTTFKFTMIEGRGVTKFNLFDYLIFLLKQTGPWLLLSFFSIKLLIKERKDGLHLFGTCIFFSLLVLLSIPKFKYSNYLLPLYPFYAMTAAYALNSLLKEGWFEKVRKGTMYLFLLTSLTLLIFPLTTKTRRDKVIHKSLEITKGLKKQPNVWVTIDSSYSFFALANLIGFEIDGEVVNKDLNWLKSYLSGDAELKFKSESAIDWSNKEFIFLLRKTDFEKIKSIVNNKLVSIVYFKAKDLILLVRKENFNVEGLTY
ncbi:MAG: 4-amino-4-deoxy-L-arabinose transferase-like glycosyltransferase [Bacteriovoracaceae bacterium]|jgi:4-amino-4-deoxy-L-arabinose transferase-like glycosyltransferase